MLEDDLKAALRPVDPPEGFEQRVMARLDRDGERRGPVVQRSFSSAWKAAAAGLAFASVAGIAVYNHQQQEQQRRGLEARDQLILALQITGKKLDAVRTQINSNNPTNNEAQSQQ